MQIGRRGDALIMTLPGPDLGTQQVLLSAPSFDALRAWKAALGRQIADSSLPSLPSVSSFHTADVAVAEFWGDTPEVEWEGAVEEHLEARPLRSLYDQISVSGKPTLSCIEAKAQQTIWPIWQTTRRLGSPQAVRTSSRFIPSPTIVLLKMRGSHRWSWALALPSGVSWGTRAAPSPPSSNAPGAGPGPDTLCLGFMPSQSKRWSRQGRHQSYENEHISRIVSSWSPCMESRKVAEHDQVTSPSHWKGPKNTAAAASRRASAWGESGE